MSVEVGDLGFETDVPTRREEGLDVTSLSLTTQQYFILSRVDGKATLREICSYGGIPFDDAVVILRDLHESLLIDLPNRKVTPRRKHATKKESSSEFKVPNWSVPFEEFEIPPFDTDSSLSDEMRRLIHYYHYHLEEISYYDLFQVARDGDVREITSSYYVLSKVFHPDRWFRQDLGGLERNLKTVFRWMNKAYRTLSKPARRREYDTILDRGVVGPWKFEANGKVPSGKTGVFRVVPANTSVQRSALLNQARKFRARECFAEASECYGRALDLGYTVKTALDLAEVLYASGSGLKEALVLVRKIKEEDSGSYAAMLMEAKILRVMGDSAGARAVCAVILEKNPRYPGVADEMVKLSTGIP